MSETQPIPTGRGFRFGFFDFVPEARRRILTVIAVLAAQYVLVGAVIFGLSTQMRSQDALIAWIGITGPLLMLSVLISSALTKPSPGGIGAIIAFGILGPLWVLSGVVAGFVLLAPIVVCVIWGALLGSLFGVARAFPVGALTGLLVWGLGIAKHIVLGPNVLLFRSDYPGQDTVMFWCTALVLVWPIPHTVLALAHGAEVRRRSPTRLQQCADCGYALEGLSCGVCPECGAEAPEPIAAETTT